MCADTYLHNNYVFVFKKCILDQWNVSSVQGLMFLSYSVGAAGGSLGAGCTFMYIMTSYLEPN